MEKTKQLYKALLVLDFETIVLGHDQPLKKIDIMSYLEKMISKYQIT